MMARTRSGHDDTIAVIQARMGSSRLPGKMMEDLAGRPLIHHIISRAKHVVSADKLYLATSTNALDDVLVAYADRMGIDIIRGPEDDVMARFLIAVDESDPTYVIRICGDAPLFDPGFLDQSVAALREADGDLVTLGGDVHIAHQGASVISRRALDWSARVAPEDPLTREHVTAYAQAHRDQLRTVTIDPDSRLVGEYKLSIDDEADLARIRAVYDQLYRPGGIVELTAALQLIRASNSEDSGAE